MELSLLVYEPSAGVRSRGNAQERARASARTLKTPAISLCILLAIDLLLRWRVSVFFSALAVLHGAIVGFLWDELDQGAEFRTGERIQ